MPHLILISSPPLYLLFLISSLPFFFFLFPDPSHLLLDFFLNRLVLLLLCVDSKDKLTILDHELTIKIIMIFDNVKTTKIIVMIIFCYK